MSWSVKLNNGRIDVAYANKPVIEGITFAGRGEGVNTTFTAEPCGEPYSVPAPGGDQTVHIFRLVPQGEGPTEILIEVFCGEERLCLRLYPSPELVYGLKGRIRWGKEPYPCRTSPGEFCDVVQSALGPADSLLCDCLFDKWADRLLRFAGQGDRTLRAEGEGGGFSIETSLYTMFGSIPEMLSLEVVEHFVAGRMNMPHYKPYDRTYHPLPVSGWTSWYCYGGETAEKDIIGCVDWLAENLKPFGADVVQIDDGYQTDSWLKWNEKFPRGGKSITAYIRDKGFKPGIWLIPPAVPSRENPELLETHPDWFLRRDNGEVFRGFGNYPYLDPTHPEVQEQWVGKTFATMAQDWGMAFFKIDGEGEMHQWYAMCRKNMHDPAVSPEEAYRGWLRIIRKAIGPEGTLLICATQWRAMGYGDCCRIGTDISSNWKGVSSFDATLRAIFANYWMHTIAWYCDPDSVIVRTELSLDQARVWVTLVGLSGQMLLASDKMPELPEERVELLKRIFPAQGVRPMDLWSRAPYGPYPQIWDLKVAADYGRWDVVGLFRWVEENGEQVEITAEKLGLSEGRYVLYDVWEKTYLGELGAGRSFRLEPMSCRALCVRPLDDVPLLLGTSRHITQGYPDLLSYDWDPVEGVLSGESLLVGKDPYEIRVLIAVDDVRYRCLSAVASEGEITTRTDGDVLVICLACKTSRKVSWQVYLEAKAG